MVRIVSALRPLITRRTFVQSTRAMAGETGGTRSGGEAAGDAFTKREKGNEDMFIRREERAKLAALREKLQAEKKHIAEMEKHIDELHKKSGGESN
ncbi:hypothetical protein EJ08DRAFT_692592 [Tothia fuscella]|uniref:ATPase inhibitor, mitochondrial n=1 Tax=Tothia fuscella TaxID=1048955 RepID=A0A9P4P135_9PEZI|nr:hypothetical protein EJ08DRAFT_692592 [Tothia fuscella]